MATRIRSRAPGLFAAIAVAMALAGCAAAPPAREAGPPRGDGLDLVAVHTPGSPGFDGACLGCHDDVMKRTTLGPTIKDAHAAMVPFAPDYDAKVGVTNATCVSCHARVDVIQHSAAHIRRNVDVTSCEGCHAMGGTASKTFYAK